MKQLYVLLSNCSCKYTNFFRKFTVLLSVGKGYRFMVYASRIDLV